MENKIFNFKQTIEAPKLREYEDLSIEHVVIKLLESSEVENFLVSSGLQVSKVKNDIQKEIDRRYVSSPLRRLIKSLALTESPSPLYVLLKVLAQNSYAKSYLTENLVDHMSLLSYAESDPGVASDVLNTLNKYKNIIEDELNKNLSKKAHNREFHDFDLDGYESEDEFDLMELLKDEHLFSITNVIKPTTNKVGSAIAQIEGREVHIDFELLQRLEQSKVSILDASTFLSPSRTKLLELLIQEVLDRGQDVPF